MKISIAASAPPPQGSNGFMRRAEAAVVETVSVVLAVEPDET